MCIPLFKIHNSSFYNCLSRMYLSWHIGTSRHFLNNALCSIYKDFSPNFFNKYCLLPFGHISKFHSTGTPPLKVYWIEISFCSFFCLDFFCFLHKSKKRFSFRIFFFFLFRIKFLKRKNNVNFFFFYRGLLLTGLLRHLEKSWNSKNCLGNFDEFSLR